MAHVLVVDDEADLVWAVGHALHDEGHTVRVAYDGLEALEIARRQRPDLILLDVSMPRLDGFAFCQSLRGEPGLAGVPVLFLTGRNTVEDRVRGFDEGGDDYLVKPFDLRELKARTRALLRRAAPAAAPPAPSNILSIGELSLNLHTREVRVGGAACQLTPAEFDLLSYLMQHPNEVCPSERLLREVWGYTPDTAEPGLVRWHVMNLRSKIERDPSRPTYLCTVPRHGYILRGA